MDHLQVGLELWFLLLQELRKILVGQKADQHHFEVHECADVFLVIALDFEFVDLRNFPAVVNRYQGKAEVAKKIEPVLAGN